MRTTTIMMLMLLATPFITACDDKGADDTTSTSGPADSGGVGVSSGTTGAGMQTGTTGGGVTGSSGSTGAGTDSGTGGETGDSGGDVCQESCDLFNQAACGDGQRCASWICDPSSIFWDARVCAAIGTQGKGDPCKTQTDPGAPDMACGRGLFCFGDVCIDNCIGSLANPTCPDAGEACILANEGNLAFCAPKCDPMASDCPPGQDLCLPNDPANNGFICIPPADPENPADAGEPCGDGVDGCINCCKAGQMCLPPGKVASDSSDCNAQHCCARLCDLTDPNVQCGPGELCQQALDTVVPGYEHVGVCALPGQ